MRFYFLLFSLGVSIQSLAQYNDKFGCQADTTIKVTATINNLGFRKLVYLNKDSIHNGFKLTLSDTSYKVAGFTISIYGKYMDVYVKDLSGDVVNEFNLPALKQVRYIGDKISIGCITATKDKKLFSLSPFWIIIK